jgi:protein disulfide-isomerase
MSKWLLLIVGAGAAYMGWTYREPIRDWLIEKKAEILTVADKSIRSESMPATPNPAPAAVSRAREIYPALALAGSAFNLRFVALYNEAKIRNPRSLSKSNWPLELADRTARELGIRSVPGSVQHRFSGWSENYAEAMESAKADNKKLLLDFTGSDWCGYCIALDKEVLSTSKFQAWAAENVILVRVDFPEHFPQSNLVKEQNAGLQKKYSCNSYPTILVTDIGGNVLGRRSGYDPGSGADAYIAILNGYVRR